MPTPDDQATAEKFRQWAHLKAQQELVSSRMNRLRDDLMATIQASGDRDERGNFYLALPVPITVGDKEYNSIKREARTTTTLNEDAAIALARNKGLENELIVQEPHIDLDALYAAWQRGKITEEELDGLFEKKTTYAFKSVSS